MHDVSRRDLLKATAAAGAGAVVLPGLAAAGVPGVAAAESTRPGTRARSAGGANWPKAELTGKVVRPSDSDYADASLGWNQLFIHYPMVVVFARHTQDVVNALIWAQQNDVAFRVRSGRHNLQGWNAVDNGLVIDVGQLKSVQIDPARLTAKLGAGISQLEATTALARHGLVVPTGEAASVGLIGATLGGGLGPFTRSLGMACDHVMAAEIVVASRERGARVIKVDLNHNSDLLFALRGAGNGNFGVITSLTYKVTRAPKVAYLSAEWDTPYPLRKLFRAYQSALTKNSRVGFDIGFHPSRATLLASLPNGSVAQVKEVLASILSIGKPTVTTQHENWGEIYAGFQAPEADQPGNAYVFSQFASRPFPERATDVVNEFILGGSPPPTDLGNIMTGGFGGAVKRSAPPGGTAFAHRDALFFAQIAVGWGGPRGPRPYTFETAGEEHEEQLQPVAMAWVSEFSLALRQSAGQELGAYFNVPNVGLLDWETAYFRSNFARLRKIKAKYDPDDIFQYEQSIPPATPQRAARGVGGGLG
jgi:hypothetical protein